MTEPTDVGKGSCRDVAPAVSAQNCRIDGWGRPAGGLAASKAATAAPGADNLPPNVPERMKTPGDAMGSQPYGTPSLFETGVIKNIPKNLPQHPSASAHRNCVGPMKHLLTAFNETAVKHPSSNIGTYCRG
jgi:sulfane dehydrogenase subunit SoxC